MASWRCVCKVCASSTTSVRYPKTPIRVSRRRITSPNPGIMFFGVCVASPDWEWAKFRNNDITIMPDSYHIDNSLDVSELYLLLLACYLLKEQVDDLMCSFQSLLSDHIREQRRLNRAIPEDKTRVPWSHFVSKISEKHFRRMFRMEVPAFTKLCKLVEDAVGEETFCSEACMNENGWTKRISGEVKMGIGIRMLAGGSYLDLVPLFDTCSSHLYTTFDIFLNWILATLSFPLVEWLRERNWKALESLAAAFAEKSNGMFYDRRFGSQN